LIVIDCTQKKQQDMTNHKKISREIEELENEEWFYSLDYVLQQWGPERVVELLRQLQVRAINSVHQKENHLQQ